MLLEVILPYYGKHWHVHSQALALLANTKQAGEKNWLVHWCAILVLVVKFCFPLCVPVNHVSTSVYRPHSAVADGKLLSQAWPQSNFCPPDFPRYLLLFLQSFLSMSFNITDLSLSITYQAEYMIQDKPSCGTKACELEKTNRSWHKF